MYGGYLSSIYDITRLTNGQDYKYRDQNSRGSFDIGAFMSCNSSIATCGATYVPNALLSPTLCADYDPPL